MIYCSEVSIKSYKIILDNSGTKILQLLNVIKEIFP